MHLMQLLFAEVIGGFIIIFIVVLIVLLSILRVGLPMGPIHGVTIAVTPPRFLPWLQVTEVVVP